MTCQGKSNSTPLVTAIREEGPHDFAAIDAINLAAFANHPHSDHTEHVIVRALRDSGQLALSLVAEIEGKPVGHIAFSLVAISDGAGGWYGLGPLAVLPEHQGKGIGQALVNEGLRQLRAIGAAGCVLVGAPAFYSRSGFRQQPGIVFPGIPPEYFQALHFNGPLPSGTVAYHDSFHAGR